MSENEEFEVNKFIKKYPNHKPMCREELLARILIFESGITLENKKNVKDELMDLLIKREKKAESIPVKPDFITKVIGKLVL